MCSARDGKNNNFFPSPFNFVLKAVKLLCNIFPLINFFMEIKIKDHSTLPRFLYHLVPQKFFDKFIDQDGNYDCRNKEEWNKNSPFVHTSPTKQQLKERVADINWADYSLKEKFLLLKINPKKVKAEFTLSATNGYTYHHIWGHLPKESFKVFEVRRSGDGRFMI